MQTLKQIVHEIAEQLPEEATFDDAIQALTLRKKIEDGLHDIAEGRIYSQEQVELRLLGKTL